MKNCSRCKNTKLLSCFRKNKTTKDGLRSECKSCGKLDSEKYLSNPINLINRTSLHLKKYGISYDDYLVMNKSQNGLCLICKNKQVGKSLAVDHCHETGNVRGLLCTKCNLGLGYFNDDINLLSSAIDYLR